MKVRIYYHHTDGAGVVYYAKYLEFLEEARTEFLEERGLLMKDLISRGVLFVVGRQEIDYKSPAIYGDILHIDTRLSRVSTVKMEFEYEVKNQNDKLICLAKTLLVCVDKNLKPRAIPEEILKQIT